MSRPRPLCETECPYLKWWTCWPARCFTSTFPQPLSVSPWKPAAVLGLFYWTTCSLWSHGPRLNVSEHTHYRAFNRNPAHQLTTIQLNTVQCLAVTEFPNNYPDPVSLGFIHFSVKFTVAGWAGIESSCWYKQQVWMRDTGWCSFLCIQSDSFFMTVLTLLRNI